MRSINLILKRHVQLADWEGLLGPGFPRVWLEYSEGLASREQLPEGVPNKLGIEDGDAHVLLLERPTTIREYEPEEVEALRRIVGEPKQFLAMDYTDDGLLQQVLAVLLQHGEGGDIVVEDDDGNLASLEDFVDVRGANGCGPP